MRSEYGSENEDLTQVLDFQNIYLQKLHFEGDGLNACNYEILIQEFVDGKALGETLLFDTEEDECFKVKSNNLSIKFFFQTANGRLKTYVTGPGYASKKRYFKLLQAEDGYIVKDFFGRKDELELAPKDRFVALAILPPAIREDGTASYCDIVQSNIEPDSLGKAFGIKQYFLVSIKFKYATGY